MTVFAALGDRIDDRGGDLGILAAIAIPALAKYMRRSKTSEARIQLACVPAVGGGGPGYYEMSEWTNNPVWSGLDFQMEQAHGVNAAAGLYIDQELE